MHIKIILKLQHTTARLQDQLGHPILVNGITNAKISSAVISSTQNSRLQTSRSDDGCIMAIISVQDNILHKNHQIASGISCVAKTSCASSTSSTSSSGFGFAHWLFIHTIAKQHVKQYEVLTNIHIQKSIWAGNFLRQGEKKQVIYKLQMWTRKRTSSSCPLSKCCSCE